jgi:hypothetical protein
MIKVTQAQYDVEPAYLKPCDLFQYITTYELILVVPDVLSSHILGAVLNEIRSYLNAGNVFGTCLQNCEAPPPVMARNIEYSSSFDYVFVELNDRTIPVMQSIGVRPCFARSVELGVIVKKPVACQLTGLHIVCQFHLLWGNLRGRRR